MQISTPDSSSARSTTGPAASTCSGPSSPRAIETIEDLIAELELARIRCALDNVKLRILEKIRAFRDLADSPANLAWLARLVRDTEEGKFASFGEFAINAGTMRNLDDEIQRAAGVLEQEREEAMRPAEPAKKTTNGARLPA